MLYHYVMLCYTEGRVRFTREGGFERGVIRIGWDRMGWDTIG